MKKLQGCAPELEPGHCASCGALDITRTCLSCRKVRYCTPACQKQDWKSCHKPDCGGLEACQCFSCASDRHGTSNSTPPESSSTVPMCAVM